MNDACKFVISRFDVRTDDEVLIESAELLEENGEMVCRVQGVPDRPLSTADVASAISAEPILSEIRANQVTRITAAGAALDELPFVIRVPGHRDEFDEPLWSEAMREEHIEEDSMAPALYRVLYVNDERHINEGRWSPWPIPGGQRMLPNQRVTHTNRAAVLPTPKR